MQCFVYICGLALLCKQTCIKPVFILRKIVFKYLLTILVYVLKAMKCQILNQMNHEDFVTPFITTLTKENKDKRF